MKKKTLPPNSWEAHPIADHGEVNKTLIIAVISVVILVALILLLFVGKDLFVGKAITPGELATGQKGILLSDDTLTVGETGVVPIMVNLPEGKESTAFKFELRYDQTRLNVDCTNMFTNLVSKFENSEGDTILLNRVNHCADGVIEAEFVALPSDVITGQEIIAEIQVEALELGLTNFIFREFWVMDLETGDPIPLNLIDDEILISDADFSICRADDDCDENEFCSDGGMCRLSPECIDDEPVLDRYTKGTLTTTWTGVLVEKVDSCTLYFDVDDDGNRDFVDEGLDCSGEYCGAIEYFCSDLEIGRGIGAYSICPNGCSDGVCLRGDIGDTCTDANDCLSNNCDLETHTCATPITCTDVDGDNYVLESEGDCIAPEGIIGYDDCNDDNGDINKCSETQYCSELICVNKLPDGDDCTVDEACLSGNCVDNVCVAVVCTDNDGDNYYVESSGCDTEAGFLGHNDCNDANAAINICPTGSSCVDNACVVRTTGACTDLETCDNGLGCEDLGGYWYYEKCNQESAILLAEEIGVPVVRVETTVDFRTKIINNQDVDINVPLIVFTTISDQEGLIISSKTDLVTDTLAPAAGYSTQITKTIPVGTTTITKKIVAIDVWNAPTIYLPEQYEETYTVS